MSKDGRVLLLSGNEAVAQGAVAVGCRFFAGYPITPSSEIAEQLSLIMPRIGGKFIQMEDEIASIAAVIGASLAGVKSMTATSGPGYSLKQENIGYAALTEVPCVIFNVQRGGPSTGLPTSPAQADVLQAKWGTHGDHPVIVLAPTYVREVFDLTVRAFNLSEEYRVPVVVLLDEINAHMREKVELPASVEIVDRTKPTVSPEEYKPYDTSFGDIPPMANYGEGYRFHVTGLMHDATGFPSGDAKIVGACQERLLRKIDANVDKIAASKCRFHEEAETLVISFGSTARSVNHAVAELREEGLKLGTLRPLTLFPFPLKELEQALSSGKTKRILVVELNMGQLILEIQRYVAGRVPVLGLHKADGEPITPEEVVDRIREVHR
ncbi:MAG TPA: 2-oxoacid:acceptor oxidoreductase subunit alpha [Acidobacteriota bacterium]|nr:2-oxoacid:acceptor oxidoreductase subunit alpha [Acidobacteriota bacterium]